MVDLPPSIEQQIADMTDADFAAFTARVRAPDAGEAFKAAAGKHISGDQLESICSVIDPSKFAGADGSIDEAKVQNYLTSAFGVPAAAPQQQNWGQQSGGPGLHLKPGDHGRIQAAKRHGLELDPDIAAALGFNSGTQRGANGRAAAQRRANNRTPQGDRR